MELEKQVDDERQGRWAEKIISGARGEGRSSRRTLTEGVFGEDIDASARERRRCTHLDLVLISIQALYHLVLLPCSPLVKVLWTSQQQRQVSSPLEIVYLRSVRISGALAKDCVLTVDSQGPNKLESGA